MAKQEIIHKELSYQINGIVFMVHNEFGRFCSEGQYGDAIEQKLKDKNIFYEREKIIPISFLGEQRGRNRIDFLIENKIILEIKCRQFLSKEDYYQVKRYLESTGRKLGILVNFRKKYAALRRILNSYVEE